MVRQRMRERFDVIALGAAAVDLVATVDEFPQEDGIVLARDFREFAGGSTANVAVALAKLGLRVGFVGKVGDDQYGEIIREDFARHGVDISRLIVDSTARSALTFIAVNAKGQRMIFALGGAALLENPGEIDVEYLAKAKILYVGEAYPCVVAAAIRGVRDRCRIVYAPGGVFSSLGLEKLKPLIECADIVLLSRAELLSLLKSKDLLAGEQLLALGVSAVVITLGSRGSYVIERGRSYRVGAIRVERPLDTTGAGDAFAAGLLFGIIKGLSLRTAVKLGAAAAALKIQHLGPRSGLPTAGELLTFARERALIGPDEEVQLTSSLGSRDGDN